MALTSLSWVKITARLPSLCGLHGVDKAEIPGNNGDMFVLDGVK